MVAFRQLHLRGPREVGFLRYSDGEGRRAHMEISSWARARERWMELGGDGVRRLVRLPPQRGTDDWTRRDSAGAGFGRAFGRSAERAGHGGARDFERLGGSVGNPACSRMR